MGDWDLRDSRHLQEIKLSLERIAASLEERNNLKRIELKRSEDAAVRVEDIFNNFRDERKIGK